MAKITLQEQCDAVERAAMNHRAHVKNLWKLVSEKKRPQHEAVMAQSWLEAHEAAAKTMRWLLSNQEKIMNSLLSHKG